MASKEVDEEQAKASVVERAKGAEPMAKHGNKPGEENSRNRDSNTTSARDRGADYLTRRIARDRPHRQACRIRPFARQIPAIIDSRAILWHSRASRPLAGACR
ncbi:MAG: hypothetical protein ACQESR_16450 [Planctomycetota bacterium]